MNRRDRIFSNEIDRLKRKRAECLAEAYVLKIQIDVLEEELWLRDASLEMISEGAPDLQQQETA